MESDFTTVVDIGGTKTAVMLLNNISKAINFSVYSTPRCEDKLLSLLASFFRYDCSYRVLVGLPGPVKNGHLSSVYMPPLGYEFSPSNLLSILPNNSLLRICNDMELFLGEVLEMPNLFGLSRYSSRIGICAFGTSFGFCVATANTDGDKRNADLVSYELAHDNLDRYLSNFPSDYTVKQFFSGSGYHVHSFMEIFYYCCRTSFEDNHGLTDRYDVTGKDVAYSSCVRSFLGRLSKVYGLSHILIAGGLSARLKSTLPSKIPYIDLDSGLACEDKYARILFYNGLEAMMVKCSSYYDQIGFQIILGEI